MKHVQNKADAVRNGYRIRQIQKPVRFQIKLREIPTDRMPQAHINTIRFVGLRHSNISSIDKTSDSPTHPIKSKPESHNNWKRPSRLAILPEQI
ncbi:hypothetical protein AALA46_06545 [Enterocloster aldenensis]|uniref:hypothetical protein n=1 Tax=Enterocloster aldenensis TaxID=358742 RepID=UPI0035146BAC